MSFTKANVSTSMYVGRRVNHAMYASRSAFIHHPRYYMHHMRLDLETH